MNRSIGKTYFSYWPADRKQFLTVVPDGLRGSKPAPVSTAARSSRQEYVRIYFLSLTFEAVRKTTKPSGKTIKL
jgi:hypothetical protein